MTTQTRLAVDIGGTFTDIVLETGEQRPPLALKVLTTPRAPELAVLDGAARLLAEAGIEAGDLGVLLHGTTLATNAIIERRGARTALVTTEGFRDVLDIANEGRFDQYDINLQKPVPLVPRRLRFTVPERIDVHGRVLLALDEQAVTALVPRLREAAVQSIAIGFMHAYANDRHERRTAELLAAALPEVTITLASEVCPEIREYERFSTASANAYVQPLMTGYLRRLGEGLRDMGLTCPVLLMTSGGGLTSLATATRFPIRLVESGPAAGAILAVHIANAEGIDRLLSFDMGGTTAKICLIEDRTAETARSFEVDRATRHLKGSGLPLRIPVIEMVEIGAGGGSLARVDTLGRIAVGPDSAGSEPGPACYGRGGSGATITDADLVLGRIDVEHFAGGSLRPDLAAAEGALHTAIGQPLGLDTPMAAFGVCEMVDETMANAARVHTVERGFDVAEHVLVAFGGAAPLHAARMAEKLRIDRVMVPANAGVGSAVGMLRAAVAYEVLRSRHMRLAAFDVTLVNSVFEELRAEAQAVVAPAAGGAPLHETRLAYMRYVGQGHEVAVPWPVRRYLPADMAELAQGFDDLYRRQFARTIPGADIEILTFALTLTAAAPPAPRPTAGQAATGGSLPPGRSRVFDAASGAWCEVPVYARDALRPGTLVEGPCLVTEAGTGTWVSEVFRAGLDERGNLLLTRRTAPEDDR